MNKIESLVYNLVRHNPALKQGIRDIYQTVFDLLPRKKEYFAYPYDYKENYFFGFHDVSPFSDDERKVLSNKLLFDLTMPKAGDEMQVGYFDFADGKLGNFNVIGTSTAWNYHKGCRLQWLSSNSVIFNSAEGDKLVSVVKQTNGEESHILPYPIDAVSHNGLYATSFSYERLEECMPGYGYPYKDDGLIDEDSPLDTGLYIMDMQTGVRNLLVSLDVLAKQVEKEYREGYIHFVTHSEFSKHDRYVSFLHRWVNRHKDRMKLYTRMMVYDLINNELIELPTQRSGSHYVWNSRNEIISSNILDGNSCHALFSGERFDEVKCIARDILNSDGHQTFVDDDVFVTDTYPDKWRMAKLMRVDITTREVMKIASVYSPKSYQTKTLKKHIACDLHPRVSPSGKYLCFDSPRTGKRCLYVMKLTGNVNN